MVIIRRADSSDAEALAILAETTFRDTFSEGNDAADMALHCEQHFGAEIQRREIQDPNYVTLLAEMEGVLVAFAQVRLHAPKHCVEAERPAELYRIYVSNRWHGHGIAQQVMNELMTTVKHAGNDRIWLGVWEHNQRALAFYRKYGFEVVGDHIFQFGSDPQRDLVMAAVLCG